MYDECNQSTYAHFCGVSLMKKGPRMLAQMGAVNVRTSASFKGRRDTAKK